MSESKSVAAPTRDQFKPLAKVENLSQLLSHPDFKERIGQAAGKYVSADRMIRTFALAVQKTPKLAQVSPMSFMGACITLAWLSLEPNTPLGLAHMIPFDVKKWNPETRKRETVRTDVQVIVGYQGYLELMYRSEKVLEVHCDVVWKGDEFSYEYGSNRHLRHKPSRGTHAPDEMPEYAYAYAKFDKGGEDFIVMTLADVLTIRARSQGYQSAMYAYDDAVKANKDPKKDKRWSESPWVKDFPAMMKKTPLRAAQKYWPRSVEIATAATIDGDASVIDFSKIETGEMVVDGSFEHLDEPDQIAHEQTVPGDLNFGDQRDPVETSTQKVQTRVATVADNKPTKTVAKKQEPAQQAPEAFYPLFNAFGEDEDGDAGPTSDPAAFAKGFVRLYSDANETDRESLRIHNSDSIAEASRVSAIANGILTSTIHNEYGPETQAEERFSVPRTKTKAGGWDVVTWTKKAAALIATIENVGDLRKFEQINAETSNKLPPTAKTVYQNAFQKRLEVLAPPIDDEIPDFMKDEVPVPGEEDVSIFDTSNEVEKTDTPSEQTEWDIAAQAIIIDFKQAASVHDLEAVSKNGAIRARMGQIIREKPELKAVLETAFTDRMKELKG